MVWFYIHERWPIECASQKQPNNNDKNASECAPKKHLVLQFDVVRDVICNKQLDKCGHKGQRHGYAQQIIIMMKFFFFFRSSV